MSDLPHLPRFLLLPAALAGSLLVTACGGDTGPSQSELEAMIAPEASSGADEADLTELAFDPESVACAPLLHGDAPGAWETSAPRAEVAAGEDADLRLRDAEGSGETAVSAQVVTPDGDRFDAATTATGDGWAQLAFPSGFEAAPEAPGEGTYTVIWTTGGSDSAFISCDGFRIG
ncbi:hypothetical protein ACFOVU_14970 [Nocardiopsis sediminis]|uniref:Secreted protein n=1 Tax=Nocardiopsis sediminis TaxID=1778267 RepID=A0ABV8FN18_9ACTN